MAGKTAVVKALLEAGADPDIKTHPGYTALDYAKDSNHYELSALLRTAGKGTVKQRKKLFQKWLG